jgi:hypothetical protein
LPTKIIWLTSQTGWSLGNIHFSNNNGSLPFYVNLIYHRQDLCRTWLWATTWVSNKKQALLTLPSTWVRPRFFVGSLMVIFVLCFVTDVACVSGFSILDCHFGSLKRCSKTLFNSNIDLICTFFVTFFSATIDGRNLIFGHKLHIGTPYRGKRFWTHRIPTSCLPTL